jgi:hypothetical protein
LEIRRFFNSKVARNRQFDGRAQSRPISEALGQGVRDTGADVKKAHDMRK